jgi:hypothetical protein
LGAGRLCAAFALATVAALAAAAAPARASAEGGKAAPTSGTCRICHTDPKFGAAFSHRGLEESGDGCLTCHAGPEAHVKARGGKGSIPIPSKLAPGAERELCLQCHEEETYGAAKHLQPKGKDARCTSCHEVHGTGMPVREKAGPPPGGKTPADAKAPGAAVPPGGAPVPAKGRRWLGGRVEAGWRWVGHETGRTEQDLALDQGPRLFSFGLEGGADDADPRAPRAEADLDGLGDPHESARLRARGGDSWKATADARRDELPFLGQGGLHGGESLRETLSAGLDLKLSPTSRLGLGYDRTDHEGEVRGTILETGVLLPIAVRQDRLTQEGWASLDFVGSAWHAKLRQGWLAEDGTDTKHRNESAPGAPDLLTFHDGSDMSGPLTSAIAGAETMDGHLSVEARASWGSFDRDVDTAEFRSGNLGGPYTRSTTTTGDRRRVVGTEALDTALAFGDRWALEASAERRTLHEDGTVVTDSTTTDTTGTTTTSTRADDGAAQRTLEERLGVKRTLGKDFIVRGGALWTQDSLDYPAAADSGTVRSRGFFADAEGPVVEELRVRADVRTDRGSGVFTPLTTPDRDAVRLGATYRDADANRGGIEWGRTNLQAGGGGLGSRGDDFHVWGGVGKDDEVSFQGGFTLRKLSLTVDNLSYVGSTLTPGKSVSAVRSHVLDFSLSIPLTQALRLTAGGAYAYDRGTLPVRSFDGTVALRWQISKTLAARIEFRTRTYDELGVDTLDYSVNILEVSLEMRF